MADVTFLPLKEFCHPSFPLHNEKGISFPAAQRESPKNPTSPASRGAEAIPAQRERRSRRAYHPCKAREDARRLAPCGERRTGYTTCDSDALHHTDRGSTGVVGGVEGLAPLTPCRQPRRLPHPDAGLKPQASGKKNRLYAIETEEMTFRRSEGNLHAEGDAPRRATRKPEKTHQPSEPGRRGDPRAAGAPQQARISPATREDARRLPPAASGGQGTRHATVTPSAIRTGGVRGS